MATFKDFNESLIPKSGDFLVGHNVSGTSELKVSLGTLNNFAQYRFPSNLVVSLANNKTFGKYTNGQTILCSGVTPDELIRMAIAESINPTVNLTSSTAIAFNQASISNILSFNYTINTLSATVASVLLEWRRNNSGSWTALPITAASSTFTHTDTNLNFNTQPYNYRYTVTDSSGASTVKTLDITPAGYSVPTITLSVIGVNISGPESNSSREKGNVESNISGNIVINSSNVNLVSYQLQYSINGNSTWSDIGTATSISGGSYSIPSTNHSPTASNNANSISYRVKVVDAYQTNYSSSVTINFYNIIFYGSSSSAPSSSSAVRALANKIFTNGLNPFDLETGLINRIFVVAMPSTLSITQVIDLDALGYNLTNDYVLSTTLTKIKDYAGNDANYKVYIMTNSLPYTDKPSPGHRHRVTRG